MKVMLIGHGSDSTVIVLVGPGGTGKTTILHAVTRDRDVQRKYHHGIAFIELGQHITLAGFMMKLTRFVDSAADPEWLSSFIMLTLDEGDQSQAMAALAEHFAEKPMLLIMDDVWSADNKVYKLIQNLAVEVKKTNSNFKLLMSTRFQDIAYTPVAGAAIEVMPHPHSSQTSKRILCRYADVDDTTLDSLSPANSRAATSILQKCAGLPLTLAVAGRAIRLLRGTETPEENVWLRYWEHMTNIRPEFGICGASGYEGLFDTIRSSLLGLQATWPDYMLLSPDQVVSSFCVFEKQAEISVDIVALLWGIHPEQAEVVMNNLCGSSILSAVPSIEGDSSTYHIHDHIHDFGTALAERMGTVAMWHRKLVSSLASLLPIQPMNEEYADVRAWWSEEFVKDSYVKENLIRHLTLGGELHEAIGLLVDYRWIQRLNADNKSIPFQRLLADSKLVYAFVKEKEDTAKVLSGDGTVKGLLIDLEYFIETLEMIMPACTANRDECPFQLHGRLCTPNAETGLFDWCLQSIEKYASCPWARPMEGMLHKPGPSLKRVLRSKGFVNAMVLHPNKDELFLGCGKPATSQVSKKRATSQVSKKPAISQVLNWGGIEVLDSHSGRYKTTENPSADALRLYMDTKATRIISILVGGNEISCLSEYGVITVWRAQKKVREFSPFASPCEATCMAWVGNNTIACGSNVGTLRLLHATTWELQQDMEDPRDSGLEIEEAMSVAKEQHSEHSIQSICSSRDGIVLISLSQVGFVQRWDRQTGHRFPWISRFCRGIQCMTVNSAGNLMAVGMPDNRVHICDTTSGKQKKVLKGHRGRVLCLLFSHDGNILYSGGIDRTVQCWDVYRGSAMGRPLRQHNAKVTVLALNSDGTELYSASENRICVSRARPRRFGNRETGMESGFGSEVQAFCLSNDKKTIVTVETDMIRFRDLRDPITRYEALRQVSSSGETNYESLPIMIEDRIDLVGQVALSHDGKSIAYSVRQRNLLVEDNERTIIYVAQKRDKHSWSRSQPAPEISSQCEEFSDLVNASVTRLEFMPDDSLEVVFQPRIGHSPRTFLLIWSAADYFFRWEVDNMSDDLDVTSWNPSRMSLKLGKVVLFDSSTIATLDVEAMPHSEIRGAIAENAVVFDENMSRLWVLNKQSRLQYIDLVKESSGSEIFPPAPLPKLQFTGSGSMPDPKTPFLAGHDVFISFAGPDKQAMAVPLSEILTKKGMTCFMNNSDLQSTDTVPRDMAKAMEEAPICVVIASPEYAARSWTARQLQFFQRRGRVATDNGMQGPVIIPVFYRLALANCRNLNLISDVYDADMSVRQKYEELVSNGAAEVWEMRKSIAALGEVSGVENEEGATNAIGPGMTERRRMLIVRVATMVEEARERLRRVRESSDASASALQADDGIMEQ